MDPKKIYKDPQVGPLSELKNKPHTKSLGPFLFRRNEPKQPENSFFIPFLAILGSFGHPQIDPKRHSKVASGRDVWPIV
jgi:hypothetical protein